MTSKEHPSRLVQLLDTIGAAIIVVGREDDRLLYFNRRMCEDLRKTADEIEGRRYQDVFWPDFSNVYMDLVKDCADGQEHTVVFYWAERVIWEQVSARSILWDGQFPAVLLTITNITEVGRAEYEYMRLAYFDNLLELPNGQKLEEDINELVNVDTVALIFFEIERFKAINDLYGWDAGDYLLIQIRDWLLETEDRHSQLYRVHNGFCLLGRGISFEDAQEKCEKINRRFNHPWAISSTENDFPLFCSVQIGLVYGKYVKNGMRKLLSRTIHGHGPTYHGYTIYNEQADEAAKESLRLRQTLINCILEGMEGFSVHYHPIVTAQTGQWIGAEALCRWTTPEGQRVSPLVFISLAEQLNLIGRVDNWVRKTAMESCVGWGLSKKQFFLDINFSPTQAVDDRFISELRTMLETTNCPPGMLNLEITESAKMDFSDENLKGLHQLKQTGISLSLDDFGTGYSSLESLINVPAAALKTEKLFLDNIESDAYRQYLLRLLIDLAHELDMMLIAEGVETQVQKELLEHYGVDYMQGFFFSYPLPAHEFEKSLWRFKDKV